MIALNGLTRPWDAFIQTICARTKKLKFDDLWEECIQEETRVANREALLASSVTGSAPPPPLAPTSEARSERVRLGSWVGSQLPRSESALLDFGSSLPG
jgi:hypothetical protein